jgi:aerobic-type carbon monoxide dehydrogenase small subunit (CoxS/CutS family)
MTVKFTLTGKPVSLTSNGDRTLLWVLRTDLGLTGTKYGCAAVVLAAGEARRFGAQGRTGGDVYQ